MQLRILAAVFLISSVVHAYPHIGDKVQWDGNIKIKTGDITPVRISKEVVSFDEKSKKWTVKYVATVGEKVTTEFIETDELYSPAKHKQMISSCKENGGSLEQLTAPAGNYETCKITTKTADGSIVERWWGDIPFGIVGRNTADAGEANPDLNAIAKGL